MFSLSKKSDDLSGAEPLWHSNFRNSERLPDTKVVRTTFFVNTAAIALTLALFLWTGYREFHIRSLEDQITEALRLSQVFASEEKKLLEAENFLNTPISSSEFISLLSQTLPKEISIEYV